MTLSSAVHRGPTSVQSSCNRHSPYVRGSVSLWRVRSWRAQLPDASRNRNRYKCRSSALAGGEIGTGEICSTGMGGATEVHEAGAAVIDRYTTACQPGGAAREVVPPHDDRSCQDPEAPSPFCTAQYGVSSRSSVVACLCRPLEWSGCDPGHGRPRDRGNIESIRPLGLRSLEPGELVPV